MKRVILLLVILFSLANSSYAYLNGSCHFTTGTCNAGEDLVDNLYFSYTTNAHVCYNESFGCYNYKLCCGGSDMQFLDLPMASIVSISSYNNAHIEDKIENNYNYDLSFWGSTSPCSLKSTCSGTDEYCLFSISHSTNAHAGDCASYPIKFCCYSPALPPGIVQYLNIDSFIASPVCTSHIDEGDKVDFDVSVKEYINSIESDSEGADVTLIINDTSDGNYDTEDVIQTNSSGDVSFNDISFPVDGEYEIYAIAQKAGFSFNISDICTITVDDTGGGNGGGNGTYTVFSDCYCPSGETCSDGYGVIDVNIYDLDTNEFIRSDAKRECFLDEEEDVPFIGFFGFLMFLLIIGVFYNNEIFKKKNNLNKNNKEVN